MAKLLQVSILIMTLVIPMRLASAKSPTQALKKVTKQTIIYNVIYLILCLYVLPRLG